MSALAASYSGRVAQPSTVLLLESAYQVRVYRARTAEGEDLETCLQPGFWSASTRLFRIGDELVILADDDSWEWRGRVTSMGKYEIFFRELFHWTKGEVLVAKSKLPALVPPEPRDYSVKWCNSRALWRVLSPTNEVIKDKFESQQAAEDYLRRYQNGEVKAGPFAEV